MTGGGPDDVLREAATALHERPSELEEIDPRTLSPFLRALVATDGTVTTFLQAYSLEHVTVQRLTQTTMELPTDDPWLEAPGGTKIIEREVAIEGSSSGTLYLYACSQIVVARLPEAVRDGLEVHGSGLGRLLNEERIETRRELLWYGKESLPHLPARLRQQIDTDVITRTYRIISRGKPIMLITERIPADLEPTATRR